VHEEGLLRVGRRIELPIIILALLDESSHASTRVLEKSFREIGLSMMQAGVMVSIKLMEEPATPAKLSRWLFRERHTVFALIKQMEKRDLIKCVKDLERKNMIRVTLTQKGEEVYRKILPKIEVLTQIMSCLSDAEKAELAAYLSKLRTSAVSMLGTKDPLAMWPQSPYYSTDKS
jgi:DNA-binding MarR family transcriptional regulator